MAVRASVAEVDHALALFGLRAILASEATSRFEQELASWLLGRILEGDPSGEIESLGDRASATLALAALKAFVPASKHVGQVGEKIERRAVLTAMIPCETQFGLTYVQKLLTADGESIVWFSKAGDHGLENICEWFSIKGTVKAHKEYHGRPETALTRCKVTSV